MFDVCKNNLDLACSSHDRHVQNSALVRVVQNAKKWDSYPATSFLEPIGLVMKENAKKVGKSYHLGVPIDPPWSMYWPLEHKAGYLSSVSIFGHFLCLEVFKYHLKQSGMKKYMILGTKIIKIGPLWPDLALGASK